LLETAIGSGAILKYELEQKEVIDRIEKMFWEHADRKVSQLTGSAEDKQ
jgi:hypothetical protein